MKHYVWCSRRAVNFGARGKKLWQARSEMGERATDRAPNLGVKLNHFLDTNPNEICIWKKLSPYGVLL